MILILTVVVVVCVLKDRADDRKFSKIPDFEIRTTYNAIKGSETYDVYEHVGRGWKAKIAEADTMEKAEDIVHRIVTHDNKIENSKVVKVYHLGNVCS